MTIAVPKGLERREVTLHIGQEGVALWNIIWDGRHPMRGGKLPSGHPCHGEPTPMAFLGSPPPPPSDTPIGEFRRRGYFASCFPEGDGICFKPSIPMPADEVIEDIERCFYFKVTNAS